ncbi:putative homing endonuclease, partial [Vibrio phage 275E43-1]
MSKRMTTSELFEIAHEVPNGLVRKVSQGNQKAGNAVGTLHHSGYYQCTYQGKTVLNHRIIAVLSGIITEEELFDTSFAIDHIDGIKVNNHPSNLRKVTHRENASNKESNRKGKLAGTSYLARLNKWQAEARKDGKRHYLGVYPTMELAHKAYKEFI